jgi:hypothetical protein
MVMDPGVRATRAPVTGSTTGITKAAVAGLGILGALLMGAARPSGPEDAVARRIVERLQDDRDRVLRHRYVESVRREKLARDGRVRSSDLEVYEVFTRDGRRLKRALSHDPDQDPRGLSPVRQEESRFLRPARDKARPAGAAAVDGLDLASLVGCFRLYSLGRDALDGRETLRFAFTAIDGCLGDETRAARLLGRLAGTLWLDTVDYGVLRVRGYLQRPVTFGLGIVGRVERFEVELDREPLGAGFYATTRIAYRARGSSLLLNRFDVRSSRLRTDFTSETEGLTSRVRPSAAVAGNVADP